MIKLKDILLESEERDILVPRRSKEERAENHIIAVQKQIQNYIKNGSVGDLDLGNAPIESLPDILKTVGGDLELNSSQIKTLPDNLTVNGDLNLSFTKIKKLPDNLTVNGSISLYSAHKLNELPLNLNVGGSINLFNTPLERKYKNYTEEQLRQLLPGVKGRIII